MREFTIKSDLAIEASAFWSAASLRSVNWELAPIVSMTSPKEWQNSPICSWEGGADLFKSWILLFGLIPIDRHSFRLRHAPDGFGFDECSSSWINKEWNHRRTILAHDRGCTVSDQVAFVSRIPLASGWLMPIYKFAFWHRHRRLRKRYAAR
jgi:hypothetical protein